MNSVRYVSILAFCALAARVAMAQDVPSGRIYLGPVAGFDGGFEASEVPVYGGSSDCGEFEDGFSYSPSLGVSLMIPDFLSERLGLTVNVGGSYITGSLSADPLDPVRIYDAEVENLVDLDREFRLKSERMSAYLDLLARYRITDQIVLSFGPSVAYQFSADFTQTDNVLGPGDYAFADGQRERPMEQGPDLTASAIQFGPTLRAGYELRLSSAALLLPELSLHVNLSSPVKDAAWRRYAAGAQVALLFDITPSPDPPPPPPPPPDPVVVVARKNPRLAASLKLYGVDEQNRPLAVTRVSVNEILYRQHASLIPSIFFDREASVFPERYSQLTPGQVDTFTVDALAGLDEIQIQRHALDIIGFRLRENPQAKVTLYGSASKDEPAGLARERAETVRKYLVEVWGIDRSRILLSEGNGPMQRSNESTEDGRADNRRVEITSNMERIVGSAITEQIVRDFNPPIIKMDPAYDAEAGMKRWELTVTQGGRTIARYTNSDSGALKAPELTWHLASEALDSTLDPLVAQLVVEDSTGATVTASSEVALTLERRLRVIDGRVERNGDREQIAYTLVAFNYNSAELGKQNEGVIREIAAAVRNGAHVTITGYTDRIGEEQRNVELSGQRASRVAAALRSRLDAQGVRDVQIKATGAGIETARFENDYPEGRVLSRGVSIIVDQHIAQD